MYNTVMHQIDSSIHSVFGELQQDHHEAEVERYRVVFQELSLHDPPSHGR
jgi:hypothetical protein